MLERQHGGYYVISCLLPCVLYCMEGEFGQIIRIVFLPHTNTVILLEPCCGTITEPGLPVTINSV